MSFKTMIPFKIRASGAGSIMTNPKLKSETLSETCKKYLKQQWIQDVYDREKDLDTLPMMKGILNEEQGITMLSEHLDDMLFKNNEHRVNEYMTGTADIIHNDTVYDIKCSWDIFTFGNADISKDYRWQLQVYMELWGLEKAALVYVLTDTPEGILHSEVRSILYKMGEQSYPGEDRYEEIFEGLRKIKTYNDIADANRIKIFNVDYDKASIELLQQRVEECREFYSQITL